jgi:citronellyl-CoA synthetase
MRMGVRNVLNTFVDVARLIPLVRELKPRPLDTVDSYAIRVEENAEKFPDRPMITFEGQTLNWRDYNALANRYAHAFKSMGIGKGDVVGLVMENRVEFIATVTALQKLGAAPSLINTNLRGRQLVHCLNVTSSKYCVFGEELAEAVAEVKDELGEDLKECLFVADKGEASSPNWARSLDDLAKDASDQNPTETQSVTLAETAYFLFTSGTTGLPKAAVVSNRRALSSSLSMGKGALRCTENERIYLTLPLYHGTGLMLGVGASWTTGASIVVRRKFSASKFLDEVREHNANRFIYIGELCRYLMAQPEKPNDADNPLVGMLGNGLRPDIWMDFKRRFGIKRISEFYVASEGNVAFINLLNKDLTVGMTPMTAKLIKYDVDADEIIRTPEGRCIEVEKGEPGLLLGEITDTSVFEGYTNKEATEKKIIRDAFEEGDRWFDSGDLIKQVNVGFAMGIKHYQFVDRVGDTFRWKSENVSTNEVGEIINGHPHVNFCNVYGVEVPAADGRAGMAALTLHEHVDEFDPHHFSEFIKEQLPAYARPVFLRIKRDLDVTGTMKMVKGDLRKEAYDLANVDEPLFVLKPGAEKYEPLDSDFHETIRSGGAGY